ncbi:MAG TPA: helix-turn-helix domain-containing protein [Actinomycetota bacterium]
MRAVLRPGCLPPGARLEAEVAELLKVSVGTVRRWRREGIGPPVLWAGGRPRYRRGDVDSWLQREQESEEEG